MKVTVVSLILLMLDAIIGNALGLSSEFKHLSIGVLLIWIIGATFACNVDTPFKIDIGIGANIAFFLGTSDYKVSKAAIVNQILIYIIIIVLAIGYSVGIISSNEMLFQLWDKIFSIFLVCYSAGAVAILAADLIKRIRSFCFWTDALLILGGILLVLLLVGVSLSFFIDFPFVGVNPFRFNQ